MCDAKYPLLILRVMDSSKKLQLQDLTVKTTGFIKATVELIPKLTNQSSSDDPRIHLERITSKTWHKVPENDRCAVGHDKETPAQTRTDRKTEGRRQENA